MAVKGCAGAQIPIREVESRLAAPNGPRCEGRDALSYFTARPLELSTSRTRGFDTKWQSQAPRSAVTIGVENSDAVHPADPVQRRTGRHQSEDHRNIRDAAGVQSGGIDRKS